jgi:hypothetical protein
MLAKHLALYREARAAMACDAEAHHGSGAACQPQAYHPCMTYFEELAQAHAAASRRQDEYREEARQLAVEFVARFRKFLECPEAMNLTAHKLGTDVLKEEAVSPVAALELGEDGVFRLMVALWFSGSYNVMYWPLRYKKNVAGAWEIGVEAGKTIIVAPKTYDGLLELFLDLVRTAKYSMDHALGNSLARSGAGIVGFKRS